MLSLIHNNTNRSIVSRRTLMRIMLADDEAKVLSALRLVIGSEPGMVVVAEATELHSVRAQLSRHRPDLLLLDWELPDVQSATFLQQLREEYPALMVVALSSQTEAGPPGEASGVDAFVSKGDAPEHLLLTLHRLAAG